MCSMDGLADNDVAGGRKQKILQKMKKIVREACDEICQNVCHKPCDCRINHFCCPVARADIYSSKMDRHMRDGVVWCEKMMRHESIRELEEQQNKKRRIREETRGQAEDRIAMQLATDESLAAEMEEDGGGGQGDH